MGRCGGRLLMLLFSAGMVNSFGNGALRGGGHTEQQEHAINRLNLDAVPASKHKVCSPRTCSAVSPGRARGACPNSVCVRAEPCPPCS